MNEKRRDEEGKKVREIEKENRCKITLKKKKNIITCIAKLNLPYTPDRRLALISARCVNQRFDLRNAWRMYFMLY